MTATWYTRLRTYAGKRIWRRNAAGFALPRAPVTPVVAVPVIPTPPSPFADEIPDHCAQAIKRLAAQYQGKAKFEALICAFTDQVQAAEHATWQVIQAGDIDDATNCVGVQLDGIGARVGQLREGLDDATYRIRIHARILANASSGVPEDLSGVLRLLLSGGAFHLARSGAGTVIMTPTPTVEAVPGFAYAKLLHAAAPAGVRVILEHSPAGTLFGWDDDGAAGPWAESDPDPSAGIWAEAADGQANLI